MFELVDNVQQNAVIKVVGVGGGGGNAVRHMLNSDIEGVEFICANTDAQALTDMDARQIIQLGGNITKGLGAGANPEVGRQSALEDRDRIAEAMIRGRVIKGMSMKEVRLVRGDPNAKKTEGEKTVWLYGPVTRREGGAIDHRSVRRTCHAGGPSGNARATRNPYVGSRHNIDCNECDCWTRHARACPQRRDDYCRGGLAPPFLASILRRSWPG